MSPKEVNRDFGTVDTATYILDLCPFWVVKTSREEALSGSISGKCQFDITEGGVPLPLKAPPPIKRRFLYPSDLQKKYEYPPFLCPRFSHFNIAVSWGRESITFWSLLSRTTFPQIYHLKDLALSRVVWV